MKKIFLLLCLALSVKGADITPYSVNSSVCLRVFQYDAYVCNYFQKAVNFVFATENIYDNFKALETRAKAKDLSKDEKNKIKKKAKSLENNLDNLMSEFITDACFYYKHMNYINRNNIDNYEVMTKDGLKLPTSKDELDTICYTDNPVKAFKELE